MRYSSFERYLVLNLKKEKRFDCFFTLKIFHELFRCKVAGECSTSNSRRIKYSKSLLNEGEDGRSVKGIGA